MLILIQLLQADPIPIMEQISAVRGVLDLQHIREEVLLF